MASAHTSFGALRLGEPTLELMLMRTAPPPACGSYSSPGSPSSPSPAALSPPPAAAAGVSVPEAEGVGIGRV